MDDIVERALEQAEDEMQDASTAREFGAPRILAIGCGREGVDAIDHIQQRCNEVETLALSNIGSKNADFAFTIEKFSPAPWDSAEHIDTFVPADAPLDKIADILQRADLCFILADLTKADALPAVATAITATEHQPPMTVGLFTLQQAANGKQSAESPGAWFDEGLQRLSSVGLIDATTVAEERNVGLLDARADSRTIHAQMVAELTETLVQPSLINLDYADLTTVLCEEGVFTVQVTQIPEERTSHLSAELDSGLLTPLYPTELAEISSCWTHITAGPELTLGTAQGIADNIKDILEEKQDFEYINPNIWTARIIDPPGIRLQIVYGGIKIDDTLQLVIER